MSTESKSAFARRLGVSPSYVTQLAQDGRLVLEGKKVVVEASLARIEATKAPEWDAVRQRHAKTRDARREAVAPAVPLPASGDGSGGNGDGAATDEPAAVDPKADTTAEAYRRFRAVREHYQARQAKMRVAMKQGRLAPMAEVRRAGEHGGAGVRGMLENLADQIAPRCAPVRDPARASAIIGKLFDGVLKQHDAWIAKTAASLRKVGADDPALKGSNAKTVGPGAASSRTVPHE